MLDWSILGMEGGTSRHKLSCLSRSILRPAMGYPRADPESVLLLGHLLSVCPLFHLSLLSSSLKTKCVLHHGCDGENLHRLWTFIPSDQSELPDSLGSLSGWVQLVAPRTSPVTGNVQQIPPPSPLQGLCQQLFPALPSPG